MNDGNEDDVSRMYGAGVGSSWLTGDDANLAPSGRLDLAHAQLCFTCQTMQQPQPELHSAICTTSPCVNVAICRSFFTPSRQRRSEHTGAGDAYLGHARTTTLQSFSSTDQPTTDFLAKMAVHYLTTDMPLLALPDLPRSALHVAVDGTDMETTPAV